MNAPLSAIEEKVYQYLLDYLAEHTFQPSVRDIGRHCHIASTKSVTDLLASLEDKGYIEREPGRSRGVKLIGYSGPTGVTPVPVVQMQPGDGAPQSTGWISLDRRLIPSAECFLVAVTDDDARALGVHRGDYVMVHPVARSRDGDTVVARVAHQALVRTMVRRGQTVVLRAGTEGAPIELGPADDFAILGVLAGVIRPPLAAGSESGELERLA